MAPMTQTRSTAVSVLLAVHLCIGEISLFVTHTFVCPGSSSDSDVCLCVAVLGDKACAIWSSAGSVVQRGSSFRVFCTFNCMSKRSMLSFHPPKPQKPHVYNSTTLYVDVTNITERRTFSCKCVGGGKDPCGQDIAAGCEYDMRGKSGFHCNNGSQFKNAPDIKTVCCSVVQLCSVLSV